MKLKYRKYTPLNNKPLLTSVQIQVEKNSTDRTQYPLCLPIIQNTKNISFSGPVTFFVGKNGSGKSTLLEALAHQMGFGAEGGSKNIAFTTTQSTASALGECMQLTWNHKPRDGYFFRAESFFNVASYLDTIGGNKPYGGTSLHHQSHGESFFSFFSNRLGDTGIYILDEPEAALSPQRQLALLQIIHNLTKNNTAQFIIATHSPILLAYPKATIYSCDTKQLTPIEYTETDHYQTTKRFLDNPELYMKHLFS